MAPWRFLFTSGLSGAMSCVSAVTETALASVSLGAPREAEPRVKVRVECLAGGAQ